MTPTTCAARRRHSARNTLTIGGTVALALFFAIAAPAAADDVAVQRCRGQLEREARLACYDAIPIPARPSEPIAENALPAADFGRRSPGTSVAAIHSSVADDFDGWRANARIQLANGQIWQVADDSTVFMKRGRRNVMVRRGALSSFYLDFEDSNQSPRVRRVD